MFARLACSALNRILAGESWAPERLRAFGGQHLCLRGGPLALALAVSGDGLFHPADGAGRETPAVTIELPEDAPFRLLSGGRDAVFAGARLSGAADFAETLAFVFRNLRWDIEDDLAHIVGDIAARRIVRGGTALLDWQRQAAGKLGTDLAEYLSDEAALLVPSREAGRFAAEVDAVRNGLRRLEDRLAKL